MNLLDKTKLVYLRMKKNIFFLLLGLFFSTCDSSDKNDSKECIALENPPFGGTIFIDPDIITPTDPTTFISLTYNGQASRIMFDRRENNWVTLNPYLFPSEYDDGITIEIQVNPEFGSKDIAKIEADKYAPVIGQLTTELRKDVKTVWIHKGLKPFGGGNNNLLIHTDWAARHYEDQGILEETFIHEASHTSLDSLHASSAGWLKAQTDDCKFISYYAEENPIREDISESYLPYFAIRYRPERIRNSLKDSIENAIPNRIKYFDAQSFNMHPIK